MTQPQAFVGNAGDEEQVQKAGKKVRISAASAARDLAYLLTQPQFQRFLKRLLDFCSPYASPFSHDDRNTNLNIGKGDVGRYLIKELEAVSPDAYPKAMIAAAQQELV